ncbi:MAG TPA: hypothetical protein VMZ50_11800 [Phycisphaerae bacterium]|nr:hypothetical protein [Phycisphaerae bacterium]
MASPRGARFWSIGPIRGFYQPEEFTEEQVTKTKDHAVYGNIDFVQWLGYGPRRVTLTFVVNGLAQGELPPQAGGEVAGWVDPEFVWLVIQSLQGRFNQGLGPNFIPVNIPGWGDDLAGVPQTAIIERSSIRRTHIAGKDPTRAVRAVITVALVEARSLVTTDSGDDKVLTGTTFKLVGSRENLSFTRGSDTDEERAAQAELERRQARG